MPMKAMLSLLILSALSCASPLEEVEALFEKGAYEEVLDRAGIAKEAYGNAMLHWYWGRSAEAMGQEFQAINAYERVVMLNPEHVEALLRLAALYKKHRMEEQCVSLATVLKGMKLTPEQRAKLAVLDVEEGREAGTLTVRTRLYAGYDSNVNINPGDDVLLEYYQDAGMIAGSVEDVRSSRFIRLGADASYIHEIAESGGWYFRSDGHLLWQNNFSAHEYDLTYGRLYAGAGYQGSDTNFYLPLFYDRMHYLERQLLHTWGARPTMQWNYSPSLLMNAYLHYDRRRYLHTVDRNRNDNIGGGGVGIMGIKGDHHWFLRGSAQRYRPSASEPARFTEKSTVQLHAGGSYGASWARINAELRYRDGNYADTLHQNSTTKRKDTYKQFDLGVAKNIAAQLTGELLWQYINNDSNYKPGNYSKHVFSIGVSYDF